MTATALIIEYVICGFFSFIWMTLLVLWLWPIDLKFICDILPKISTWSTALILISAMFFYQLGFALNTIYFALEGC